MTEIKPQFLDELTYAAKFDRQSIRDILTEGIVATGDLEITELDTPGMGVKAASGAGYVQGDQAATQGHYRIYNDASKNLTIAASDPTNPRKDRIIAQIYDSIDIGGVDDEWVLEVLTGVAAGVPDAPALPDDALDLAIVLVGNGVTEILNADITDQRIRIDTQNLIKIVKTDTIQTITGKKTFSDDIVFSGDKAIQTNVKARAYLGTNQLDLVNNTWTKVLLDTEDYDIGADFASYKFIAPVSGYYQISAGLSWLAASVVADKAYMASIYKNGVAITYNFIHASLITGLIHSLSDVVYLAVNDYIELYANQVSGVNTVDILAGSAYTYLAIHLLSV